MSPTILEIVLLVAAFLVGGVVKGVSGIGMPLLIIPILIQFVSVQSAIAIMSVPVLITNLMPLSDFEATKKAAIRFKKLLLLVPVGIAVGSLALLYFDARKLDLLIGLVLGFFSLAGLFNVRFGPDGLDETFWNPIAGFITGLLGGFSSFYGPTVALYFSLIKVPREEFITSGSIIFALAASSLYVIMAAAGLFTLRDFVISVLGLAPIFVGVYFGNKIRKKISEPAFNRLILWFLLAIALNQIRRGVGL